MSTSNELDNTQATITQSGSWEEKEKSRLSDLLDYDLKNFDKDDKELKSIITLASIICKTQMGCITIVGSTYVNFLSEVGCFITGLDREKSFCHVAIEQDDFFEVCDTTNDDRFSENIDTPLKYYGAYPLISPKGYKFGNLCVCDLNPKKMDESQKIALKTLAEQVMVHLELRKQNIKLILALERAEKLSKFKDDFVSNMSHELRTPLNAINGFVEILSKSELNADQKEAVSIIMSSCEILITLINDILDFSKIESGKLAIDKSPFNFRKAMKNIRDLLSKKAEENDIELNLIIDDAVPKTILGDKVRINQIIMNLIGNSIKFTNKGSVSLEVNLKEETKTQVALDFSVKDTGIGIPEDKLDSIFERYEQVGQEITRKYGGTGLGLSISKNLVELHHGKLNVRSVFGKGTEFYFTIVYDKDTNNNEEADLMKKKIHIFDFSNFENLKNIKILICEDNVVNIKLIKNLFKNKPIFIEIAENGKVAIEILNKNKDFDVILMDIHMPEMNGIETTKYIRNTMKLTLPIIGFTANKSKSEKDLCLQIGMNDYITKSFKPEEFYQNLSEAMKSKKVYQEDLFQKIDISTKRSFSSKMCTFNNYKKKLFSNINGVNKRSSKTTLNFYLNNSESKKLNKFANYCSDDKNFIFKERKACMDKVSDKKKSFFSVANIPRTISNTNQLVKTKLINKENENSSEVNSEVEELVIKKNLKEISGDDEEFEKDLIEIFLKEFPIEINNLDSAIKSKNFDSIKFVVHKMKSPLAMLGLNKLIEIIRNIEMAIYEEDYDVIIKNYNDMKDQVKADYKLLNHYLQKLSFVGKRY